MSEGGVLMQLVINITEQDYLQYNVYHAEHTPNYRGTIIALGFFKFIKAKI